MGWVLDVGASVVSLLAVVAAFWAVRQSRRANRLVGVYRQVLWSTNVMQFPEEPETFLVRITNEGESPARDVTFTLRADPLHVFGGEETVNLVPAKSSETFQLRLPAVRAVVHRWDGYFDRDDIDTRSAVIAWTDLEGERRSQDVVMPRHLRP